MGQHYWGWAGRQLNKIPGARRGNIKVAALLIAAFYSGYLAWSDEHAANGELTTKYNELLVKTNEQAQRLEGDMR